MSKFLKILVAVILVVLIAFVAWRYLGDKITKAPDTQLEEEVEKMEDLHVVEDNLIDNAAGSLMVIEKLIAEDPDNLELLLDRIKMFLTQGTATFNEAENADKALALILEYLRKGGDKIEAKLMEGYAYEIKREYEKAIELYTEALGMVDFNDKSKQSSVYSQRGHAADLAGDLGQAEGDYNTAYELDPQNEDAIHNVARHKIMSGELEAAKSLFLTLIELTESSRFLSEAYLALSVIETDAENIEKAIAYADAAITQDTSLPLAYANRAGLAVLYEQDYQNALSLVEKTLAINVNQVAAYEWGGITHMEQDNFVEAEKFFRIGIEAIPKDITLMPYEREALHGRFYYYIAIAQALQGKAEESFASINTAMESIDQDTFMRIANSIMEGEEGPLANLMSLPEFVELRNALLEEPEEE